MDDNTTVWGMRFKTYLYNCALNAGVARKPGLLVNITSPKKDLLDSITPDALGLTDDDKTKDEANPSDDTDYTCEKYYNDFVMGSDDDKSYKETANKLFAKVQKLLSRNYEDDDNYLAITSVAHSEINSTALGDGLGQFKAYLANAALIGLTSKALARLNNDLVSGVDAANAMTQQQSLQRIQTEGIGNFKFFAYTAPYVYHILLGVIYFSGVFMLLVAIMLGFDEGKKLIFNYYMGLIGFAFIEVGLAVANNVVNYFASKRAVDIVAALGSNPATITGLNQYYVEMANYTGIVGFLGIAIVTLLPGFILKGQVSAAVNSIGSLQGQFKGGIDNAMHEATDQIGRQKAYEQEMEDFARKNLEKMGLSDSIPPGMAASDFYSQMYNSQSQHNSEWAAFENKDLMNSAAHMKKMEATQQMASAASANDYLGGNLATARSAGHTQGAIQAGTIEAQAIEAGNADFLMKGTKLQTVSQLQSTATYGQNVTLSEAVKSGVVQGMQQAGKTKGEAAEFGKSEQIMDGAMKQTAKSLETTAAYGQKITLRNAQLSGELTGIQQAGADTGLVNAVKKDKKGKDDLFRGAEVNSRIAANKTIAAGEYMEGKDEVDFMSKIKTNSKEDLLKQEKHGKKLQEKYGRDLKGSYQGRDLGSRLEDIEEANLQAQAGKADAIRQNLSKNKNMYYENTEYGEMSQQQKTAAKIQAQGGIDKAVAVDVAEAGIKAGQQKAATAEQISQALQKENMDKKQADEMAKKIVEGSKQGAEEFKKAIETISQKTAALTAGKEKSDYTSIDTIGGGDKGQYADTMAKAAFTNSKATLQAAAFAGTLNDKDKLQNFIDSLNDKSGGKFKNFLNEDGSVKTGREFLEEMVKGQAGLFNMQNSLIGADGSVFTGAMGIQGKAQGKINAGLSSLVDNTKQVNEGNYNKGQLRQETHDGFSNALQKYFGMDKETADKYADELIEGWDIIKDAAGGAAVVGGGFGLKKWLGKKNHLDDKASKTDSTANLEAKKTKTIPTDATTHLNSSGVIDTPSSKNLMGGLGSDSTHKPTFMSRLTETFDNVKGSATNFTKGAVEALTHPATLASIAIEGTPFAPTSLGDATIQGMYGGNNVNQALHPEVSKILQSTTPIMPYLHSNTTNISPTTASVLSNRSSIPRTPTLPPLSHQMPTNNTSAVGAVGGSDGLDEINRQIRNIGMNTFDHTDILDDLQQQLEESKQYIEDIHEANLSNDNAYF